MHVHLNQFDPNLQLSMAKAAERAAAEKEAALVRKKLGSFSSLLSGDIGEDAVTAIGAREEQGGEHDRQQDTPRRQNGGQEKSRSSDSQGSGSLSTWA